MAWASPSGTWRVRGLNSLRICREMLVSPRVCTLTRVMSRWSFRRPWLETARFTAPAGNSPHLQLRWWLENPVYFYPAGRYTFAHSSQGAAG